MRAQYQLVQRMVTVLRHRGPDDEALYVHGPIGLGARRLRIIDHAGGAQPLFNEDHTIAAVFNGEIYNFRDLRRTLVAQGHRFATQSDTEVIVHAYEQYGTQCVEHLRGMFAFAVWDDTRRSLFVARDRLGIKPLYYAWDGRTFLFGSELKAILQHPTMRRDIDPAALDDYFTFNYIPAPKSIFAAIRKLRPAHTLLVSAAGVVEREYWDLVFDPQEADEAECAATLRDQLREAVRLHLVSDVAVGVFLSGGVDSSTLTALTADLAEQPIDTFSIGFDHRDYDELPYARAVAERCGTRARHDVLGPAAVDSLDRLTWHFDEPFADSSMIPTYHLSALARAHVKVCCAGDGGDEVFAGYPRFAEFQARAAEDPIGAEREYFASRTWITPAMKDALYGSWLRPAARDYDPFSVLQTHFDHARRWDPLSRIQYVETKTYLVGDLLAKVDRASMAHGLEVRVPLLDHQLVEYAAHIPARFKLRDGVSKYILKRAMRDRLPAPVLTRPKMGFSMPLAVWFRSELKGWFEERVFAGDPFIAQWLELGAVRDWWAEHQRGARDLNRFMWSLLVLECWAQRFLAGTSNGASPA
jgi:asparagine synthase (glutamine-hydrolysing)